MILIDSLRFWNDGEDNSKDEVDTVSGQARELNDRSNVRTNRRKLDDRYEGLSEELEEIRKFTLENMDDIADEFENVRGEMEELDSRVQKMEDKNSELHGKMFDTLEKTVSRMDQMEKKIERMDDRIEKDDNQETDQDRLKELKNHMKKLEKEKEILENKIESEIDRLDQQKVDGKELAGIKSVSDTDEKAEEGESRSKIDTRNLTKKEKAKVKILEKLKEGKSKTQIREEIEGNVCSRQWFYNAWDELEKEEAYISGREEALIHPQDYKNKIAE